MPTAPTGVPATTPDGFMFTGSTTPMTPYMNQIYPMMPFPYMVPRGFPLGTAQFGQPGTVTPNNKNVGIRALIPDGRLSTKSNKEEEYESDLEERLQSGLPLSDSEIEKLGHSVLKQWTSVWSVGAKSTAATKARIRRTIALQKAEKSLEDRNKDIIEKSNNFVNVYQQWDTFCDTNFKFDKKSFVEIDKESLMSPRLTHLAEVVTFVLNTMKVKKTTKCYDKALDKATENNFGPKLKLFENIETLIDNEASDEDTVFVRVSNDQDNEDSFVLSLELILNKLPKDDAQSHAIICDSSQMANNYARLVMLLISEEGSAIHKHICQGYTSKETSRQELDLFGSDMLQELWVNLLDMFNDKHRRYEISTIAEDATHGVTNEDIQDLDPNAFVETDLDKLKKMYRAMRLDIY